MAFSATLLDSKAWGLLIATFIAGSLVGYTHARYTEIPVNSNEQSKSIKQRERKVNIDREGEDADDDDGDEELNAYTQSQEELKLVLVVRTDLGMTKGKIAAQCSHATLACYKALLNNQPSILKRWESLGQAKIAVQAKSEDELLILQAKAMSIGLCAKVIHDAGRTQIAAGSATVLGVGPGPKSVVNEITGHLKLL